MPLPRDRHLMPRRPVLMLPLARRQRIFPGDLAGPGSDLRSDLVHVEAVDVLPLTRSELAVTFLLSEFLRSWLRLDGWLG